MNNNDIIKELGLEKLPEDTRTAVLGQITESVLKRIAIETLEKLPEGDIDELEKMRGVVAPEEIDAFLKKKIPDYDKIVKKIVDDFKIEMKEIIGKLKE